jgi:actin-related protein
MNFELIEKQFTTLKEIVRNLPQRKLDNDTEFESLEVSLNQILLQTAVFENEGHSNKEKRMAIVSMREQIQQMNRKLNDLQTWMASEYRKRIGANKAAFECLTHEEKQQSYPEAYESFIIFHDLVKVSDLLSLLTTYLSNQSSGLEKMIHT